MNQDEIENIALELYLSAMDMTSDKYSRNLLFHTAPGAAVRLRHDAFAPLSGVFVEKNQ